MRTALVRPLALGLVATVTLGACATRQSAAPRGATPASATALAAEELQYAKRATDLRARILAKSSWTELGEGCNPGVLRTFMDTSTVGRASLDTLVRTLERIVIARGVEEPVNTPEGRELLRTVVVWEAAGARPRWDTVDEREERHAVATGLTGQVWNPDTKKCESYVHQDSIVVILPEGVTLPQVKAKNAMAVQQYVGDSAIARARREFFELPGRDQGATFQYTRIGPVVLWRDWGLVVVQRPLEIRNGGRMETGTSAGGATYLFRRVNGEWRLFIITRTWA